MRFTFITFIAALLICLLITTLLFSCMTSQKATSFLESKGELAKICADKFPVKDSIIIKDSISFDSIYVGGGIDTITEVLRDTVFRTVIKTLPAKVITKTNVQVKEVFRENTARVRVLESQVNGCVEAIIEKDKKIADLTDSRNNWRKKSRRNFWVIVLLLAALFRKPLLRLVNIPFIK